MRRLLLTPILFFSLLLPTFGQEVADSSHSSSLLGLEIGAGISTLTPMVTLEFRLQPFNNFSIDAGLRPVPWSFYGGISCYPLDPFFLQVQAGYMKLKNSPGYDAPIFESDFFSAGRIGLVLGQSSKVEFTLSIGTMFLIDHDYCSNCGFVDPATFVPHYRVERKWTPTLEFGIRGL